MSNEEKSPQTCQSNTQPGALKTGLKNAVETAAESAEKSIAVASQAEPSAKSAERTKEIGGPKGLEPTRYGDWESKGRCYDF